MVRYSSLILTVLVTAAFAVPASAQGKKASLVRVRTADGNVIVGELLSEDKAGLELLNIKTGEKQSVQKKGLKSLIRKVTDRLAARDVGIAPLVAWKISKTLRVKPIATRVSEVKSGRIYVPRGTETGIKKGQTLYILGPKQNVTDPKTGKVLYSRQP